MKSIGIIDFIFMTHLAVGVMTAAFVDEMEPFKAWFKALGIRIISDANGSRLFKSLPCYGR